MVNYQLFYFYLGSTLAIIIGIYTLYEKLFKNRPKLKVDILNSSFSTTTSDSLNMGDSSLWFEITLSNEGGEVLTIKKIILDSNIPSLNSCSVRANFPFVLPKAGEDLPFIIPKGEAIKKQIRFVCKDVNEKECKGELIFIGIKDKIFYKHKFELKNSFA